MHSLVPSQSLKRPFCRVPEFSLSCSLFFLVLCPVNFSCLDHPKLHLLNLWEMPGNAWLSPLPILRLRNSLQVLMYRQSQGSFVCFLAQPQGSLSYAVWYLMLENACFIYFVQLSLFPENKSGLCFSILAGL